MRRAFEIRFGIGEWVGLSTRPGVVMDVVAAGVEEHVSARPVSQLHLDGSRRPGVAVVVRDLWSARALIRVLARKEFYVRYRRAAFGILWAVVLPAVQAAAIAVVLTRVSNLSVPHYPLFILSGMVAWSFFSASLTTGGTAIVDNRELTSRIYFPRAAMSIATCLSNLFTLAVGLVILLGVALVSRAWPGVHTLWLLPASALIVLLTVALSALVAAVHVYVRDARYAVTAGLLVWFYVTPIFFPLSHVHGALRRLIEVNPVSGPIALFHAGAVGGPVDGFAVDASLVWLVVLGAAALLAYARYDRLFADLL